MPSLHLLEFSLRNHPDGLSPIEIKQQETAHGIALMSSLFCVLELVSEDQIKQERLTPYQQSTRNEEIERSLHLVCELGSAIADATFTANEELFELITKN
ncbi:MAG: hypothetical protein ACKVZH_06785 [Blastocatellia bacterium]